MKNEYRERVIPVCSLAIEALRLEHARQEKRREWACGRVVIGRRLRPYTHWRHWSHAVRDALRAWNLAVKWAPKDLRNALPTFAVMRGVHGPLWEQYIGHAPATVTARHYVPKLTAATHGDKRLLDERMELFRRGVVQAVEEALAAE